VRESHALEVRSEGPLLHGSVSVVRNPDAL